jgi:transposase
MKANEFKKLTKEQIFSRLKKDQLSLLTRDDLTRLCLDLQDMNIQLMEDIDDQKKKQLSIQESYLSILVKIFKPSIRPEKKTPSKESKKEKKVPNRKQGSLRDHYPNLEVKTTEVVNHCQFECPECKTFLSDTGLVEESELLRVEPRRYYIEVIKRHKYGCKVCHGTLVCAPQVPKIAPGSIYSDEVIIYWALSKYVQFIPIGRMAAISKLEGFDFPANSMIETTHYLADFLEIAYWQCKDELLLFIEKINKTNSVLENAVMVNLLTAFLQPFSDGNKRISRMLGNAILISNDLIPISFVHTAKEDYIKAILYFYEKQNPDFFKQLFLNELNNSFREYIE